MAALGPTPHPLGQAQPTEQVPLPLSSPVPYLWRSVRGVKVLDGKWRGERGKKRAGGTYCVKDALKEAPPPVDCPLVVLPLLLLLPSVDPVPEEAPPVGDVPAAAGVELGGT